LIEELDYDEALAVMGSSLGVYLLTPVVHGLAFLLRAVTTPALGVKLSP
jgi:hypothetical protein